MKIRITTIPDESVLKLEGEIYDYVDSYQGIIDDADDKLIVEDTVKAFFSSGPKWVGILFALRNKVVSIFGLKTGGSIEREQLIENFQCLPGEQLGLFKVFTKTEKEVVLGEDDKHLDFHCFWIS